MTRKLLARLTLIGIAALLAVNLFAQTSPWPFPQRNATGSSAPAGRSLTIAFWNIQWFPGGGPDATRADEARQINMVHADIAKLNADVIGMEEVRNFASASVAVQPLAGFKVDVCANFPPREGQTEAQEVAIASRLQPLSAWAERWKAAGAIAPPRGFAFAAYEIAPCQLLLVYGVHLKSNLGDLQENVPIRQESVHQLRSHMDAMQAAYGKLGNIIWIVGGDFNTSLDDKHFAAETTLRSFAEAGFLWTWQNIPASSRVTMPPDKGFAPACFDHIFCRGATVRKAWVANTSPQSSDHRAVVATFNLPPAAK
jgi:endonuclease/exonuclease/phosphatase (EEP) superfamily protein YafD